MTMSHSRRPSDQWKGPWRLRRSIVAFVAGTPAAPRCSSMRREQYAQSGNRSLSRRITSCGILNRFRVEDSLLPMRSPEAVSRHVQDSRRRATLRPQSIQTVSALDRGAYADREKVRRGLTDRCSLPGGAHSDAVYPSGAAAVHLNSRFHVAPRVSAGRGFFRRRQRAQCTARAVRPYVPAQMARTLETSDCRSRSAGS